jgi:hypothetical protein
MPNNCTTVYRPSEFRGFQPRKLLTYIQYSIHLVIVTAWRHLLSRHCVDCYSTYCATFRCHALQSLRESLIVLSHVTLSAFVSADSMYLKGKKTLWFFVQKLCLLVQCCCCMMLFIYLSQAVLMSYFICIFPPALTAIRVSRSHDVIGFSNTSCIVCGRAHISLGTIVTDSLTQ